MLRIIARQVDSGCAANVGGPVETYMKTWPVEAPEIEAWLREYAGNQWTHREIIGVEIIEPERKDVPNE